MSKLNVLSFDPSLRNWGIALLEFDTINNSFEVEQVAVIKTSNNKPKTSVAVNDVLTAKKLIDGILDFTTDKPIDVITIELPLGSQQAAAMKGYGIVIGLVAALTTLNIPMIYKSPFDIKKVIGNRKTTKEEIIDWVNLKHPNKLSKYKNQAEHQADAILAAYASINELKEMV